MLDFYQSQESLTSIEWILRAIVAFFFLLIAVKVMGLRSISQLRLLDFVMALIFGNIIAHPLSDEHLGLKGSLITMTVLVFLYVSTTLTGLHWHPIRKIIDPAPIPLVRNGQIQYKNLKKARISIDVLYSELRRHRVIDIQEVALALFESNGTVTSFLQPSYQTVIQKDLSLPSKPFDYPQIVIKEGKINQKELSKIGKDEEWLHEQLKKKHAKLPDILIATLNHQEQLHLMFYK
ncbi:DUF421 domain-containing protein [Fictibacillus barbaricus]|uniref:DUF421 domain-containing protein n=1 Tax=Fictibacillus barbaricus TaxID=182136 RepID=A0ABS2ZBT9_9BACL|nr:DUF421 domain-containing protein [Fictibacillus barbaricus]MBN3544742.1 DUF421 domain-containing protein [Fictibacillus barbaricus]GGB64354.1 DUF421 domain-containing protein [Fictibacillus barbaricus]